MPFISRYLYSNCATLVVGCTLYSNVERTAVYASKQIAIESGGFKKVYSTMSSGAIVSISTCSWVSQSQYNTYSPFYSGTRNNCGTGGSGSTIYVNDGGEYSFTGYTDTVTSYISQADADSRAETASQNSFNAGIQNYINSNTSCTYTYNSGFESYPATNYTRNNCASNCYGGAAVTYVQVNKSGYAATSNISYQDAIDKANAAAYSAARTESQLLGQANANTNGTCCCWNAVSEAEKCDGCNYRGDMERNDCSGLFRNTYTTEATACRCNQDCKGTFWEPYCDGTTRKRKKVYNCYPYNDEGTIETVTTCDTTNCGASTSQVAGSTSIGTYFTCADRSVTANLVYQNINVCYTGTSIYYVKSAWKSTNPTNTFPNTTPNYNISKGIRSYAGNNFNVYENSNACSGYNYLFTNPEPNQPADVYTNSFGGDEITFEATRSGDFTRNNCSFGYIGGTVSYSNTYYRAGLLNQEGVDGLADTEFPSDGQDYANATGSCTAQVCKIYDIVALSSGYSIKGKYTLCNGAGGTFDFFANSSGVVGTTPCVNENSVSITESGSGAGIQVYSTC